MENFKLGMWVSSGYTYPLEGEEGRVEVIAADYVVVRGEDGKPYFIGKELWPNLREDDS